MSNIETVIDENDVWVVYAYGTGWMARNDRRQGLISVEHLPDTEFLKEGARVRMAGRENGDEDNAITFYPERLLIVSTDEEQGA